MYRLKNNAPDFTVVDGPYAGRTYRAALTYADIPPEEASRFEPLAPPEPADGPAAEDKDKGGKKK